MRWLLVLLLWLACSPALAQANAQADAAPLQFRDGAEETRFHALAAELRCVMCQNQSLADSDALIALSLRREVLQLIRDGRSNGEIKDFLVGRYGDFVLYKPKVEASTWLLWLGPGLLLLVGAGVVMGILRKRVPAQRPPDDATQEW